MNILFFGLSLFFVFFLIHLAIWRIRLPVFNHSILLLVLSFLVLVGGWWVLPVLFSLAERLALILFYASMVLAYIVTYSAIEVDSPSLAMIIQIADSGADGIEKERLLSLFTDDYLIVPRVDDLVHGGALFYAEGKYYLTRKGRLFLDPLVFYRKYLLKAPKGG